MMDNPNTEIPEKGSDGNDSQETTNVSTPVLTEVQPLKPALPYPGFWQAIALLMIFTIFQALFTLPFIMVGFGSHPAGLALPILFSAMIVFAYGYRRRKAPFCEVFPFKRTGIYVLPALLLITLGLHRLLEEFAILLVQIMPPPEAFARFMMDSLGGGKSLWGSFLALVFVAPIAEETIYRGIILNGFMRRYNHRKAILGSAFLFAAMHGNPWQFFPAFCLGIFLAWCFIKTHSLIPCMFAHSINNLLAFLHPLLYEKFHIELLRVIQSNLHHRLVWDTTGLVLAISGVFIFNKLMRRADPSMTELR